VAIGGVSRDVDAAVVAELRAHAASEAVGLGMGMEAVEGVESWDAEMEVVPLGGIPTSTSASASASASLRIPYLAPAPTPPADITASLPRLRPSASSSSSSAPLAPLARAVHCTLPADALAVALANPAAAYPDFVRAMAHVRATPLPPAFIDLEESGGGAATGQERSGGSAKASSTSSPPSSPLPTPWASLAVPVPCTVEVATAPDAAPAVARITRGAPASDSTATSDSTSDSDSASASSPSSSPALLVLDCPPDLPPCLLLAILAAATLPRAARGPSAYVWVRAWAEARAEAASLRAALAKAAQEEAEAAAEAASASSASSAAPKDSRVSVLGVDTSKYTKAIAKASAASSPAPAPAAKAVCPARVRVVELGFGSVAEWRSRARIAIDNMVRYASHPQISFISTFFFIHFFFFTLEIYPAGCPHGGLGHRHPRRSLPRCRPLAPRHHARAPTLALTIPAPRACPGSAVCLPGDPHALRVFPRGPGSGSAFHASNALPRPIPAQPASDAVAAHRGLGGGSCGGGGCACAGLCRGGGVCLESGFSAAVCAGRQAGRCSAWWRQC
jgi:hypothetical protein